MRITYQKAVQFSDETYYSMIVNKNTDGEYQLGPIQLKKIKECGAWRISAHSVNGPECFIENNGIVCIAA